MFIVKLKGTSVYKSEQPTTQPPLTCNIYSDLLCQIGHNTQVPQLKDAKQLSHMELHGFDQAAPSAKQLIYIDMNKL